MSNRETEDEVRRQRSQDPIIDLENLRSLFDQLPTAIYTCNSDGLITYFNPSAVKLWGRSPRILHPEDRYCGSYKLWSVDLTPMSHDRCWMARALKENRAYNQCELIIERPDGQRSYVLANANPIRAESGCLVGAANMLVDITERKLAETAVQRLEADLENSVRDRTESLEETIVELRRTLERVRTLRGLLTICVHCKSLRNEVGDWQSLESYLSQQMDAKFNHAICPRCFESNYRPPEPSP